MNPNYTDKPIDEFLFRFYRVKSRYSRKIIREFLLRRKNAEIYSRVLRKIFSRYQDIHIGMYSYGAFSVIPQLWVQVKQMYPYTPLWKRGARGDFLSIILKSPFIPLCQRGIKTPETEGLPWADHIANHIT
jgi:hypothetical protein